MSESVREQVARSNREFMDAFARGDAARIAAVYTPDAMLMASGMDSITGADSIREFWDGFIKMGIQGARLETLELEDHGDTAYEVGRYTVMGEGGAEVDRGKFVVIWKEHDGRFKIHRDIFNSSLPAEG